MAESFSVTRRYFDDKNYPRGFARHGDYTIREAQILEQYGQACLALEATAEEERFVAVMKGDEIAESIIEKAWLKYRSLTTKSKRIYTLSGNAGSDAGDDFSAAE